MAAQGRVGDDATGKHLGSSATGPAQQGAAATFVNGQPALRVGDTGDHTDNSGDWHATQGSSSVFIEGKPAHRKGDDTSHDSQGQLAQGSPNVDVGTGNGASVERPHDLEILVEVRDATDRKIKDLHIKTECPHPAAGPKDGLVAFDIETKVSQLCTAAPITIYKSLERGTWDPGAKSGSAVPGEVHALDPKNGVRWIHAPAPEATVALELKTAAERQIVIAKADQPKAVVRMTTAYNWMELVYKAFKLTMPTGANQVALVGVREGVFAGGQEATRDDDFETYGDRQAKGEKGDGGHETKFDDLLFLAVAPKDAAIMQRVEAFECSIDPGAPDNASVPGIPLILEGGKDGAPVYQGFPCTHHGPALHLYSGSTGKLKVTRIHYEAVTAANKKNPPANHRTFETVGDAAVNLPAAQSHLFYRDETDPGILIHSTWTQTYVNAFGVKWSTGCTVLHHDWDHGGAERTRAEDFGKTAAAASNSSKIPYLVVSSKYVKSYAEWVKEVDKAPDEVPKPSSVLRKDGLVTPTNPTADQKGKYLPSFVSKGFADEVNKLYTDLQGKQAEAAKSGTKLPATPKGDLTPAEIENLHSSLTNVLFEVDDS